MIKDAKFGNVNWNIVGDNTMHRVFKIPIGDVTPKEAEEYMEKLQTEKNILEYRMYGLVPYNISPIQQAIQFGHALQEYNNAMKVITVGERAWAFDNWRLKDKTSIILNGGTTNNNPC